MSPETDILIVGDSAERFQVEIRRAFRHWQVYTCEVPGALIGRKFRRAYYTDAAGLHRHFPGVLEILKKNNEYVASVLPFATYEEPTSIDPQDFEDAVLASELRRARYAQDWV